MRKNRIPKSIKAVRLIKEQYSKEPQALVERMIDDYFEMYGHMDEIEWEAYQAYLDDIMGDAEERVFKEFSSREGG